MAKIGNLGKTIIFETSDKKILSFKNFQQDVSGRWASHERILKKPKSEFLGADLRKVTFKVELNALHGMKPRTVLKAMETMVEKGIAEPLVIGGSRIGTSKWTMSSISEAWDVVLNKGELLQATVSITLIEYV